MWNKLHLSCSSMLEKTRLLPFNQVTKNKTRFSDLSGLKDFFLDEKKYTLADMPYKDPYNIFKMWFQEAKELSDLINPLIACLATSTRTGVPSVRYMLIDSFNEHSFKFFTFHTSRKGKELKENPLASMCFFWAPFLRTVRIEGHVEQLPDAVADELFDKRSYESQINMHCSSQSERVTSCKVLMERENQKRKMFNPASVPRPSNLGWFALVPSVVEFWQIKQKKERVRYRKPSPGEVLDKLTHQGEKGWVYEYMEP